MMRAHIDDSSCCNTLTCALARTLFSRQIRILCNVIPLRQNKTHITTFCLVLVVGWNMEHQAMHNGIMMLMLLLFFYFFLLCVCFFYHPSKTKFSVDIHNITNAILNLQQCAEKEREREWEWKTEGLFTVFIKCGKLCERYVTLVCCIHNVYICTIICNLVWRQ